LIGRKLPENSLARRDNEDKVKQDETQLSAIKTLISRAAEYPQKELNRSYLALPRGAFYAECQRFDRLVI